MNSTCSIPHCSGQAQPPQSSTILKIWPMGLTDSLLRSPKDMSQPAASTPGLTWSLDWTCKARQFGLGHEFTLLNTELGGRPDHCQSIQDDLRHRGLRTAMIQLSLPHEVAMQRKESFDSSMRDGKFSSAALEITSLVARRHQDQRQHCAHFT